MARIRSIKPEFWRDGKIAKLSKDCQLFFIGIWNFADDEGKLKTDSFEISLNLPSFRSQDIVKHISSLAGAGLVRLSQDRGWMLIEGWEHQKIDRPKIPKTSKSEIQWLELFTPFNSTNDRRTIDDASTNDRRKDRIGSDRIGSDRMLATEGKKPAPSSKPPAEKSLGSEIFESYSKAFKDRYGVDPVRNAKVNKNCQDLGTRLGVDAIEIVKFYVAHNDGYYLRSQHPIGALLKDAESLYTQWVRGKPVTNAQVRQFEKQSSNMDLLEKVKRGEL